MNLFQLYLSLGFNHIVDLKGYDHIVFILALCAGYNFSEIKKILILITAFTIGHTATLALSTLNILNINSDLIEFLIPVTIIITAISNLFKTNKAHNRFVYILALFFGLIHGLGFSNYLKELLGKESSIISPLFSFNLGLELGQIVILVVYFILMFLLTKIFRMQQEHWKIYISGAAFGIATTIIIQSDFLF